MFQLAKSDVTGSTRMILNSLERERYPIHYVHGFASDGFSYFLTQQMRDTSPSPYISKLVRVCHADVDYHSYTEVRVHRSFCLTLSSRFSWIGFSSF